MEQGGGSSVSVRGQLVGKQQEMLNMMQPQVGIYSQAAKPAAHRVQPSSRLALQPT